MAGSAASGSFPTIPGGVIVFKMLQTDTPSSLVMQLEDNTDFDCLKARFEKQVTCLADHQTSHNLRVQLVAGAASDASYGHRAPTETEEWLGPAGDDDVVDLTALEQSARDSVLNDS